MNKLGNALYEIHHMDMLAAKDQWVIVFNFGLLYKRL